MALKLINARFMIYVFSALLYIYFFNVLCIPWVFPLFFFFSVFTASIVLLEHSEIHHKRWLKREIFCLLLKATKLAKQFRNNFVTCDFGRAFSTWTYWKTINCTLKGIIINFNNSNWPWKVYDFLWFPKTAEKAIQRPHYHHQSSLNRLVSCFPLIKSLF